jgi:hypothetical protein
VSAITVRVAQFPEISAILEWGRSKYEDSNFGQLGFNSVIARKTLSAAIANHDQIVLVARKDGAICGLLIGDIGMLPFSAGLQATDLVFVADAGGEILLSRFIAWARQRKVARIDMGHSQGDSEAAVRLYQMNGLTPTGRMFYLNLRGEGGSKCPQ